MVKRWVLAACVLGLAAAGKAEIKFIVGPATVPIGDDAEIKVPDGWRFVPKESMKEFDEKTKNLYNDQELGVLLAPQNLAGGFWAFFDFDWTGYIKDAASEKLDADDMWTSMVKNNATANEERQKLGYPTSEMIGWVLQPKYNPQNQRLEWAYKFHSKYGDTINYATRILGRKGVMRVTVVPMGSLDKMYPQLDRALAGFDYKTGSRYAEYIKGDKVAEVGLAALVVGGLGAAAASTGLLAKLWKFIVLGFVAASSAIKRWWNKWFGRKGDRGDGSGPGGQ